MNINPRQYRYYDDVGQHLHTLDGKPLIGTSTATKVISKPLTWWASGLAVKALAPGWEKPLDKRKKWTVEEIEKHQASRKSGVEAIKHRILNSSDNEIVSLLDKAYRAHTETLKEAAEEGTDMHAELEGYVKLCIENYKGTPQPGLVGDSKPVYIFSEWATANVKRFLASEGHCYSERLWTGGITDCIAELKDGKLIIIDFKSSREAYISQFIQAAGYDIEVAENGILDANGKLLLKLERPIEGYAIFPFGAVEVEPQFRHDTEALRKGFEAAVALHQLINVEN